MFTGRIKCEQSSVALFVVKRIRRRHCLQKDLPPYRHKRIVYDFRPLAYVETEDLS